MIEWHGFDLASPKNMRVAPARLNLPVEMASNIRENIARVEERIAAACRRSGRRRDDVKLVAVSKTHPAELIRLAFEAGLRDFGENRVQEAKSKVQALADLDATWHLVGHLQSNKARLARELFEWVHSLDSLRLAEKLAQAAAPGDARLPVLIEVNLAGETSKAGVRAGEVAALAEQIAQLEGLDLRGLMVIPPFLGQQVVKDSGLSDARGYVAVRPTYQSTDHDDIYAVGIAAAVTVPWQTSTPVGIPKTGFPTETMAHVAASNIASQVRGVEPKEEKEFKDIMAVCVMDAGNNGVIILADKMLPPRKHGVLIPGPQAHAMKVAFEKYFLWKARNGYVQLP